MKMGWWEIKIYKEGYKGGETEPTDVDLEHIAKLIKEGMTSGEVMDEDKEDYEFRMEEEKADRENMYGLHA